MISLTLPLPPSVNSFWRSVPARAGQRAKVLISEEGRRFKSRCELMIRMQQRDHGLAPFEGEVEVSGVVYFADKRRDLDNVLKPLLDVLQGAAYKNDRQICRIDVRRGLDAKNPRVELQIRAAALPEKVSSEATP